MIFSQLRRILSSVRQQAGTKFIYHAALGVWITLFYYGPQHWPFFPARPAPALAVDRWIPFQPEWALIYQSVFLVHTLALWLPRDCAVVRHYALTLAAAFAWGAVFFWFYPTLSPRPEQSGSMLYRWLISAVDGRRNALPSLHAAMGLLAAGTVMGHLRACRVSSWWSAVLALWWIALLYSTLATRQHCLLDLVAGICLGLILFLFSALIIRTHRHHESNSVSADQPVVL